MTLSNNFFSHTGYLLSVGIACHRRDGEATLTKQESDSFDDCTAVFIFTSTMVALASLSFLIIAHGALGHGGHEPSGPASGETIQQYAQRHVGPYEC